MTPGTIFHVWLSFWLLRVLFWLKFQSQHEQKWEIKLHFSILRQDRNLKNDTLTLFIVQNDYKQKKIINSHTYQCKKLSLTAMSKTKCICVQNRLLRPLFYSKGQMVWNLKSCVWKPELIWRQLTCVLYFVQKLTHSMKIISHIVFITKLFQTRTIFCSLFPNCVHCLNNLKVNSESAWFKHS